MPKERFHHIPSDRVARIDPFNRFNQPLRNNAQELLTAFGPTGKELEENALYDREQKAWLAVLGADVDIDPLPDYVTPEVRQNMEQHGLELRYVPSLDLDVYSLRYKSAEDYVKDLAEKYPNWKYYESLTKVERENHSVSRNMRQSFWTEVKHGTIRFPQLPGQWIAVETMEKPELGKRYDRTLVGDNLGFAEKSRFLTSWNEVNQKFTENKTNVKRDLGLDGQKNVDMRFLEVLEWNLLANREGWGKTESKEWTNTETHQSYTGSSCITVGFSSLGGAAYEDWVKPYNCQSSVGFRVAVVLG